MRRRTCPTCGKGGYRAVSEYEAYRRFEQMCLVLKVTPQQVKAPRRAQSIVRPRRVIMFALFEGGATISCIAQILEKNRNAVHWALKQMRKSLAGPLGGYWRTVIDRVSEQREDVPEKPAVIAARL